MKGNWRKPEKRMGKKMKANMMVMVIVIVRIDL